MSLEMWKKRLMKISIFLNSLNLTNLIFLTIEDAKKKERDIAQHRQHAKRYSAK